MPKGVAPFAALADLKARRSVIQLQYDNSTWSMGPVYRERLDQINQEIAEVERSLRDVKPASPAKDQPEVHPEV